MKYVPPLDHEVGHDSGGMQLIPTRNAQYGTRQYTARIRGGNGEPGDPTPLCGCGHPFAFFHPNEPVWVCESCGSQCRTDGFHTTPIAIYVFDPDEPVADIDMPSEAQPLAPRTMRVNAPNVTFSVTRNR